MPFWALKTGLETLTLEDDLICLQKEASISGKPTNTLSGASSQRNKIREDEEMNNHQYSRQRNLALLPREVKG